MLLSRRYTTTLSCPMEFHEFPFDTQVSDDGCAMVKFYCIFALSNVYGPSIQCLQPTLQNCSLSLETYGFSSNELVYSWAKNDPVWVNEDFGKLNKYSLVDVNRSNCTKIYSTGTNFSKKILA